MIVVDANLLVYAYNTDADEYVRSKTWLERTLSGTEAVGLPWAAIHAFLRISTNRKIVPEPLDMEYATAVVDEWLNAPAVRVLKPGPDYWRVFRRVLIEARIRGPLVTDAHLAALAIEHGGTFYTADADFRRFAGLRVINPLA